MKCKHPQSVPEFALTKEFISNVHFNLQELPDCAITNSNLVNFNSDNSQE